MERFEIMALTMAILSHKDSAGIYSPEELAREAEDLVDAAEARAAETLADKKAMDLLSSGIHEDDDLVIAEDPQELDQHGRVIKK